MPYVKRKFALSAHYVATDPDDMLALKERHMASEGIYFSTV